MFLYIILLSSGLDMSLPEFEPTTDISGNYVYTEYDFEVEDIVVEELADLPDGLTVEEPQDDSIEDEVIEEEPILEDSSFEEAAILRSSNTVYLEKSYSLLTLANGMITKVGEGSTTFAIVELQPNITYTFHTDSSRILLASSISVNTSYTRYEQFTYTPNVIMYAFVSTSYSFDVSYESSSSDPSGNDPSGGSGSPYDDTELLSKIDHIDILLRSILFVSIWRFALPLAMKIRDHIFGLKHE